MHDAEDSPRGRRDAGGRRRDKALQAGRGLEKLFDRVPPHSLDAEQSLLGSLLLDPKAFGDVALLVTSGDQFYSQAHGAIFEGMKGLYDRTGGVDVVELVELLRDTDMVELTGGESYIVELAEAVPSAAGAVRYARIVANKARLRRLIDAAGDTLYEAFHATSVTDDDTDTIIDAAQQRLFEIASQKDKGETQELRQLIQAEFDRMEALAQGGAIPGLPTGYADLDELTAGLQPGEFLVLAARPSMGKTALALNLAEQIAFGGRTPWSPRDAAHEPCPVGVFSLEMSREALTQRLLSARSGVPSEKMRAGDLSKSDWEALNEAAGELFEAPIYIDDTPGLTVLQLRARARRMQDSYGLRCIVIDYLQLLTSPSAARESRQVEVSTISRQIKALARELRVPVVCLAQLNRGAEQRERNRPRMSDLRESGSIEQDADVVMLLHREAYYHRGEPEWDPSNPAFDPENEDKLNLAELIIAKQRNGPTGTVQLVWDQRTTRFKNRDHHHGPSDYAGGYTSPLPAPETASSPPPWAADGNGDPRAGYGGSFAPGRSTGPVDGHRDGGGPDQVFDDDEPPF